MNTIYDRLSLTTSGSRTQFATGVALIALIPLLVCIYLMHLTHSDTAVTASALAVMTFFASILMLLGLFLLVKYPINVVKLRHILEDISRGTLPDPSKIALLDSEDDMRAIEHYVITIIEQTAGRIKEIEEQSAALAQAEAQRAMIASLGAACHHLGQPMSVLEAYLQMMQKKELPAETHDMITECRKASTQICGILEKLRNVATYRTEPYLPAAHGEQGNEQRCDKYILDINEPAANLTPEPSLVYPVYQPAYA